MTTEWVGAFSDDDRAAIDALRGAQVRAIKEADARAYAGLVHDDITLMLSGYDMVRGKEAFLAIESELLGKIVVEAMEQTPIKIERQGDLAYEVGNQRFELGPTGEKPDGFEARRKYTHVLRKDRDGWRFLVLMSNDSM